MVTQFMDDQQHYGVLAANVPRASQSGRDGGHFEQGRELVGRAMNAVRTIRPGERAPSYWVAVALWMRSIECSQAALLIADLGLAMPARAVVRSGVECLLAASAIWRNGANYERFVQADHKARRSLFYRLLTTPEVHALLTADQINLFEQELANVPNGNRKWSVEDMAIAAGRPDLYAGLYAPLCLSGTHANVSGVMSIFVEDEHGDLHLRFGARAAEDGIPSYIAANQCLSEGLQSAAVAGVISNP